VPEGTLGGADDGLGQKDREDAMILIAGEYKHILKHPWTRLFQNILLHVSDWNSYHYSLFVYAQMGMTGYFKPF